MSRILALAPKLPPMNVRRIITALSGVVSVLNGDARRFCALVRELHDAGRLREWFSDEEAAELVLTANSLDLAALHCGQRPLLEHALELPEVKVEGEAPAEPQPDAPAAPKPAKKPRKQPPA